MRLAQGREMSFALETDKVTGTRLPLNNWTDYLLIALLIQCFVYT